MKKSDEGRPVGLPHRFSSFIRRRPGTNLGRRPVENPSGLGAKGTEVQGFAGYRAPSPGRRLTENSPGLGANGTEMQGFAGFHAPSPCRLPAENSAVLIELSVFQTYNPICLEI